MVYNHLIINLKNRNERFKESFSCIKLYSISFIIDRTFFTNQSLFKRIWLCFPASGIYFQNYNSALVFFGLTLSFAALQDSQKTSLRYEKRIWSNPKKARTVIFFTLFTMALFFITGLLGFIVKESIIKEFAYGSLVLAIGLLGYFKLQMVIFENHSN